MHLENLAEVVRAGCDWIVTGSAVFHSPDPEATVREMREIAAHATAVSVVANGCVSAAMEFTMVRNVIRYTAVLRWRPGGRCSHLLRAAARKYENPITKDTQQPDKVLFDTAIDDIEHGRYERARLTLQTLMNTYDTSEYLAKAKLAIADSWYREGGAHGLAQAEAEYKDFILFYPTMEEAAEAQYKICNMQYQQMDKADRDPMHALRAEDECKQRAGAVPQQQVRARRAADAAQRPGSAGRQANSKWATSITRRAAIPPSANRLQGAGRSVSALQPGRRSPVACWPTPTTSMGDRFENQQAAAYTRIVKDYPLSAHAEDAKAQLKAMKRPVPEADPVADAAHEVRTWKTAASAAC